MFDPPGSSFFYLRAAIGCTGAAVIGWFAGWLWLAGPAAIVAVFCLWKALKARGTDYR